MASSAERARPRRNTAARTSIRINMEVCGDRARLAATSCAERDSTEPDCPENETPRVTVHLATQTPDPALRLYEWRPRVLQAWRAPLSPELRETAPAESWSPNRRWGGRSGELRIPRQRSLLHLQAKQVA